MVRLSRRTIRTSALRLPQSSRGVNGHRAISPGLGCDVEDAVNHRTRVGTGDGEGAALSFRRGTKQFAGFHHYGLGIETDRAADRLRATPDASREIRVS